MVYIFTERVSKRNMQKYISHVDLSFIAIFLYKTYFQDKHTCVSFAKVPLLRPKGCEFMIKV